MWASSLPATAGALAAIQKPDDIGLALQHDTSRDHRFFAVRCQGMPSSGLRRLLVHMVLLPQLRA
jgi:hypothetical protein